MPAADSTSHASLNGLYVKAQELDRGHAAPPPCSLAPPGLTLSTSDALSCTSATTQASASAQPSPSPSHDTERGPQSHASTGATRKLATDYSEEYALDHSPSVHSHTLRFFSFDTPNRITLHDPELSDCKAEELLLRLKDLCLELHKLWSFTIKTSDIARINEKVSVAEVDSRTSALLREAIAFNVQEPLFDFTIGRLSFLWKRASKLPSEATIERIRTMTGAQKISVKGNSVYKSDVRVQVDVGGFAKGAIADMLASQLHEARVRSAEINLGGNLYMLGCHPDDRAWKLDVRIPDGLDMNPVEFEVIDASAVTSGNYERFVVIDGKRYQHIVDPRTGWPSNSDIVSATVIGKSSLMADMLATTACIATSSGLAELAARHPDYRFVLIAQDGTVLKANE